MDIANMLRGVTTLVWLAILVVIVLAVARAARGNTFRPAGGLVIAGILAALILTGVSAGLVFIEPDERGVVITPFAGNLGYRTPALSPGLHWIIPFAERVVVYPISRQTYTMSIAAEEGQIGGDDSVAARTADGQEVFIDASVFYAVDPNKVIEVHIDWQDRYQDELVRPLARGIIRDEAAQFGVEEIVSERRFDLIQSIVSKLREKMEENGIILIDVVLRNITFSSEYAASVEQKQIAEQRAQEARLTVEQRRQEAEQARQVAQGKADAAVIAAEGEARARLIEAEAEAQALQMLADAVRDNPSVLTLEYIQKLAPGIQVMLIPSDSPFILPLPTLEASATPLPTVEPEAP